MDCRKIVCVVGLKLKKFNKDVTVDSLQTELLNFASSWDKINNSLPESYIVDNFDDNETSKI